MTFLMTQAQQRATETAAPDWQNLATKADLTDIHGDVAGLRGDVARIRSDVVELQTNVGELRSRMAYLATKADLAELRTRLEFMATKEDLAELRGEFASVRGSLKTAVWFAGLVIGLVQIGLFFLQRLLG